MLADEGYYERYVGERGFRRFELRRVESALVRRSADLRFASSSLAASHATKSWAWRRTASARSLARFDFAKSSQLASLDDMSHSTTSRLNKSATRIVDVAWRPVLLRGPRRPEGASFVMCVAPGPILSVIRHRTISAKSLPWEIRSPESHGSFFGTAPRPPVGNKRCVRLPFFRAHHAQRPMRMHKEKPCCPGVSVAFTAVARAFFHSTFDAFL